MSAREKLQYQCQSCGSISLKWSGQCPDCGDWNSLSEFIQEATAVASHRGYSGTVGQVLDPLDLSDVEMEEQQRIPVGFSELDRVLGGGLVPGSVILIGGEPGIGKSTLLLQAVCALAQQASQATLYVTGEESLQQIKARAQRLELEHSNLRLLAETRVERLTEVAGKEQPQVLVVDSIQTVYTSILQSAPGSVAQVRESAAQLVRFAKHSGTAVFLVGHVTKEGTLAGPRVLEHMVDTVLYFESEHGNRFRMIRAIKNRFGAVNELGVFAMTDHGLREVGNPSAIFLSRHQEPVTGSATTVMLEGSRPLLVEVQALVEESHLGNPRRLTQGMDQGRLSMMLAILHRHGGVVTYDQDVFVNIVGGVRITEPAADLSVLLAILSSLKDRPLSMNLVVFGEVGLAGEIRPVQNGEDRLREAAKHGFTQAIVPRANAPKKTIEGLEVIAVNRIGEAIDAVSV